MSDRIRELDPNEQAALLLANLRHLVETVNTKVDYLRSFHEIVACFELYTALSSVVSAEQYEQLNKAVLSLSRQVSQLSTASTDEDEAICPRGGCGHCTTPDCDPTMR